VDISSDTLNGYGEETFTVKITVTPQILVLYPEKAAADGSTTKEYKITVKRAAADVDTTLSVLSLAEGAINTSPSPYTATVHGTVTKLHVNATAKHPNAVVKIGDSSPTVYTDGTNSASAEIDFSGTGSKTIYIKVWAENRETIAEYTIAVTKDSQSLPVDATGGNLSTITLGEVKHEIHTFSAGDSTVPGGQAEYTLVFNTGKRPENVEVLVVAGGGGGGGIGIDSSYNHKLNSGGGGAGGYIYVPSYPVNADSITVKVGAGGAGATDLGSSGLNATRGGKGGDSEFGGITAHGGGGGASHAGGTYNNGAKGGSGGGATYQGSGGEATKGTVPSDIPATMLGNPGGNASNGGASSGGGGAGGKGSSSATTDKGALGGAGTLSSISGSEQWYAGGGAGGADVLPPQGGTLPPEAYGAVAGNDGAAGTGDGGSGVGNVAGKEVGGNGGSGIVIVRWKYIQDTTN
jgi:hypothetical protein